MKPDMILGRCIVAILPCGVKVQEAGIVLNFIAIQLNASVPGIAIAIISPLIEILNPPDKNGLENMYLGCVKLHRKFFE